MSSNIHTQERIGILHRYPSRFLTVHFPCNFYSTYLEKISDSIQSAKIEEDIKSGAIIQHFAHLLDVQSVWS